MNKRLIRLTEQDLHKIVKESVNKVLNEVKFGNTDRSFHANDPNAWETLKITRNGRANRALKNHDFYGYGKNKAQADRNASNEIDAKYHGILNQRYVGGAPQNPNMSSVMNRLEQVPASQLSTEEIEWMLNVIENEDNNGWRKPWANGSLDFSSEDNIINYLEQELNNRRNGNSSNSAYDTSRPYYPTK